MSLSDELRQWKAKLGKALGWLDKLDDVLEPAADVLTAAGLPQYAAIVRIIVNEIRRAEKVRDVVGLSGADTLEVAAGLVIGKIPEAVADVAAEKPLAKQAIQLVIDTAKAA